MIEEIERKTELGTILIDTTFLIPIFGGKVDLPGYEDLYPELFKKFKTVYSPLSLVECKWIVLHLMRKQDKKKDGQTSSSGTSLLQSYARGLSILASEKNVPIQIPEFTTSDTEMIADQLLIKYDVSDYFDRMIYATASIHSFTLLTEDERLHKLSVDKSQAGPARVLSWRELRSMF